MLGGPSLLRITTLGSRSAAAPRAGELLDVHGCPVQAFLTRQARIVAAAYHDVGPTTAGGSSKHEPVAGGDLEIPKVSRRNSEDLLQPVAN